MSDTARGDAETAAVCIYEIFSGRGMAPGVYGPLAEEIIDKIEGYVQQAIDDATEQGADFADIRETRKLIDRVAARRRADREDVDKGTAMLATLGFVRGDWVTTHLGDLGLVVGCSRQGLVLVSVNADRRWFRPSNLERSQSASQHAHDPHPDELNP